MKLTLAETLQAVSGATLARCGAGAAVLSLLSSAVIDSRQAGPGSLFVALPGERTDGHAYVGHAFSRGAQAALVGRPVDAAGVLVDARQPRRLAPAAGGRAGLHPGR